MALLARSIRTLAAGAAVAALAATSGCSASDGSGGSDRSDRTPGTTSADQPAAAVGAARAMFDEIGPGDPFCTAAVRRDDEIVFADAFGDDADGPVSTDTPVDIASTSKQFTGVAIELLIAEGELTRDSLVGDLVPAAAPGVDDVTVEELLIHTSGIPDYSDLLPQEPDEPATQADAVEAIAASEPSDARGSFEYSNSNYVLLAEVVAEVSGQPLPEFLAEEVFAPLDLDMEVAPRGSWTQVGDGSIWTTPTELVAWSSEYWEQTLEGPELRSVMFDAEVDTGDDERGAPTWYGSGIMRTTADDGAELLLHDGSWEGYETDWVTIPDERLAAAVTCNEAAALPTDTIAEDLLDLWRE